jgi:ribosomal protein S18 acetylase RimI-like enzyme
MVELWQRANLPFRSGGRDSQDAFAQQLASGVQIVLAYQEGDELIGVLVVTHDSRKGWINRLAVDPSWQHQGIGLRLIRAAEEYLHEQGIQVIAVLIDRDNERSIATFRQAGYNLEPDVLYLSKRPNLKV